MNCNKLFYLWLTLGHPASHDEVTDDEQDESKNSNNCDNVVVDRVEEADAAPDYDSCDGYYGDYERGWRALIP